MLDSSRPTNYDGLNFDEFRRLATRSDLSVHEKVGFPDNYRKDRESHIFADVVSKMHTLNTTHRTVLEVGPGCAGLPRLLSEHCRKMNSELHFVDSSEMLDNLEQEQHVRMWPGRFPEIPELMRALTSKVDSVIVYSVIQYVFSEASLWDFLDACYELLAPGGELLIGDIPNESMRGRFFSSEHGRETHRTFTGTDSEPAIRFNQILRNRIDDSVVLAIVTRARNQGMNAWVLPQALELPMSSRREDILVRRP